MSRINVTVGQDNPVVYGMPQDLLMMVWADLFGAPSGTSAGGYMTPVPNTMTTQQSLDWRGVVPCSRFDSFRDIAACSATAFTTLPQLPTMAKVLADFGITGTFKTKIHKGTTYIIFKGRPGLRTFFKGTRYLADNPRVVNIAAGKAAVRANVIKGVKAGGILTIVVFGVAELLDQIARDEVDLTDLGITFASDIVKYLMATGITMAAATAVATTGVVALPGAVLLAGAILISMGLEYLDQRLGITQGIKDAVNKYQDTLSRKVTRGYNRFERELIWQFYRPVYPYLYGN